MKTKVVTVLAVLVAMAASPAMGGIFFRRARAQAEYTCDDGSCDVEQVEQVEAPQPQPQQQPPKIIGKAVEDPARQKELMEAIQAAETRGVCSNEVIRRGACVEHVDGQWHGENPIAQAAALPPDDSNKWFVSIIGDPTTKRYQALQRGWNKTRELLVWGNTLDQKHSWSHLHFYDRRNESQQWRWKGVPLGPPDQITVIVQPPRDGSRGDPNTIITAVSYNGKPAILSAKIGMAIRAYLKSSASHRVGPASGLFRPRPRPNPTPHVEPTPWKPVAPVMPTPVVEIPPWEKILHPRKPKRPKVEPKPNQEQDKKPADPDEKESPATEVVTLAAPWLTEKFGTFNVVLIMVIAMFVWGIGKETAKRLRR